MRALLRLAMAAVIVAGAFAPRAISEASAPKALPLPPKAEASALRGEAPHVQLVAVPQRVATGEEITVTGQLRGYNLGTADFCLEPTWIIQGFMTSDGARVDKPIDGGPVQCRDHAFTRRFAFTNPGLYGLKLELRTTGSKVRIADQGFMSIEVTGGIR